LLIILSMLPRVGRRTRHIHERPATTRSTRRGESEPRLGTAAPVSDASDERYDTSVQSR
jgi:hypothetical protein